MFFTTTASTAHACSCAVPNTEYLPTLVKQAYKNSKAIFSGEVLEVKREESLFYVQVKFKIGKSWKNKLPTEIIIYTGLDDGDCGYPFKVGGKYLVYARGDKGNLTTSHCTRTDSLPHSVEDIAILNKLIKTKPSQK